MLTVTACPGENRSVHLFDAMAEWGHLLLQLFVHSL